MWMKAVLSVKKFERMRVKEGCMLRRIRVHRARLYQKLWRRHEGLRLWCVCFVEHWIWFHRKWQGQSASLDTPESVLVVPGVAETSIENFVENFAVDFEKGDGCSFRHVVGIVCFLE